MAKILILSDVFGTGGGAGTIAQVMAEALAPEHTVRVLTADAADLHPSGYELAVHPLRIPVARRNFLGVRHPVALTVLEAALQTARPDVALVHNIHSAWSYASLEVLARYGIRTVVTYHDVTAFTPYTKLCGIPYRRTDAGYTFDYRYPWYRHLRAAKLAYNPWRNAAIRQYLSRADVRVAVSAALAHALRANRVPVDTVIHNGVVVPKQLLATVGEGIFFGGRISTAKGMLALIRHLAVLRDHHHLRPLVSVVGASDIAQAKMRDTAAAAGVQTQLTFIPWEPTDSYERRIAASRLVVVPSVCFDSLPTVILDAMAYGRPVVASIFGGGPELVADGVTGYVADPNDAEAWADRLADLLTHGQRCEQFGAVALQRMREQLSLARMLEQYRAAANL